MIHKKKEPAARPEVEVRGVYYWRKRRKGPFSDKIHSGQGPKPSGVGIKTMSEGRSGFFDKLRDF